MPSTVPQQFARRSPLLVGALLGGVLGGITGLSLALWLFRNYEDPSGPAQILIIAAIAALAGLVVGVVTIRTHIALARRGRAGGIGPSLIAGGLSAIAVVVGLFGESATQVASFALVVGVFAFTCSWIILWRLRDRASRS